LTDVVLFDRDGTLICDVPYNGDPDAVVPGIAQGQLTRTQVEAVNARVDALVGPRS
jgi:hypothetical protein